MEILNNEEAKKKINRPKRLCKNRKTCFDFNQKFYASAENSK